ncbi:RHS repeat-associated core domain-containing protein [Geobacillus sp. YHL]|nr:RHS repeat-associated core domain-containing protein [Geobacillus sp. YHL]
MYSEDSRYIQKDVNDVITNYHYQGDSLNVLYETDASGNVVRSYIYGENGQLLAMKKGNATYFYHYNAHGDVIALTDAQGNIVARYQYDAWGNLLSKSGAVADENPYRYAGYQYDNETGLYYLIARYYHPEHGVFLSLDPDPGDADDILTQNGYAYANNNPVKMVDPDGKFAWWAAAALSGAVIDAGIYAWENRKNYRSKRFWKGLGKSAIRGAITSVAIGGAGKIAYWAARGGRIIKVGKIGEYYGVKWRTRKGIGYTYKSFEFHPPHNGHGYHWQLNRWSYYQGKFRRSSKGTKRWTWYGKRIKG